MAGSGFLILLYLSKKRWIHYRIRKSQRGRSETTLRIVYRLLRIAIPACIAAIVTSLMGIIDTAMVPARLDVAGFTMDEAAALFGQMTQKAQTLVNVPLTLSTALAASLVPAISEAIALRDRREVQERTELGIRAVMLISLPAAIGLSTLSQPIIDLLFSEAGGGSILAILSYSVIFVMLTTTLQSIPRLRKVNHSNQEPIIRSCDQGFYQLFPGFHTQPQHPRGCHWKHCRVRGGCLPELQSC